MRRNIIHYGTDISGGFLKKFPENLQARVGADPRHTRGTQNARLPAKLRGETGVETASVRACRA